MSGDHDHDDLLASWRSGQLTKWDLFLALRDPMRQSARRGIRRVLDERPDENDVDDVLDVAFRELLNWDPDNVTSVVGLAKTIARRRGIDRGRKLYRQREKIAEIGWQLMPREVAPDEEVGEAKEERLRQVALKCVNHLTQDQAEVIRATVMGDQNLSNWANERGTSHQAASRMRARAIRALDKCVKSKMENDKEGEL